MAGEERCSVCGHTGGLSVTLCVMENIPPLLHTREQRHDGGHQPGSHDMCLGFALHIYIRVVLLYIRMYSYS